MRRARRSIGGGHSRARADDERAVGADAAVAELHMLLSGEPLAPVDPTSSGCQFRTP
jgi:hypothetical protein